MIQGLKFLVDGKIAFVLSRYFKADLTEANLAGANLTGANLAWANLAGANLTGANLAGANLAMASLTMANLTGTNLAMANLTGTSLAMANLTMANLTRTSLAMANLTMANMTRTNLAMANLTGTNLAMANLTGAMGLLSPSKWLKRFTCNKKGIVVFRAEYGYFDPPKHWVFRENEYLTETPNYDRGTECGCGVSFSTKEWVLNHYPHGTIWECLIEWPDVADVVVPYNTDGKARCRRLKLIRKVV